MITPESEAGLEFVTKKKGNLKFPFSVVDLAFIQPPNLQYCSRSRQK